MSDRLFIGIDSGTQGTKAVVLSEETGNILAESYQGYKLYENSRGGREQDPQLWLDACTTVLKQILAAPGVDRSRVCAIGVSGQQHGCVILDKADRVIRPAKLWCDTETVSQCGLITSRAGGPEAVQKLIGNQIAVGFTASKLLWLKENEPENYAAIETVMLPHDYINYWLTGEKVTEYGDASGTAYFDVENRRWSAEILKAIDPGGKLADSLPRMLEPGEAAGLLRPALAEELQLPHKVLIAPGGGDNMMAAIGTGNVKNGIVTASLGTSGTIYSHANQPVIDQQGELAAFCSSTGGWLPLICTMNVTVSTEIFRELFTLSLDELNSLVASSDPGAGGLLLLPYFNGERTPALPTATATLAGMTSTNMTKASLLRAAMEGATFGLRYGLDVLCRNGITPREIRLVGGGAKSSIWRQLAADIFNCEVVTLKNQEAGATGAALQALWSFTRQSAPHQELNDITDRYVQTGSERNTPDSLSSARYTDIYQRYLELGEAMKPTYPSV